MAYKSCDVSLQYKQRVRLLRQKSEFKEFKGYFERDGNIARDSVELSL